MVGDFIFGFMVVTNFLSFEMTRRFPVKSLSAAINAILWTIVSVVNLIIDPQLSKWTLLSVGTAAAWWWLCFKQRPPRKRKPSKAAARIKNLGHRLILVPSA